MLHILERDAVLIYSIISRLPHQSHVAGIGGLESPGEESGYRVSADYTHAD